MFSEIGFQTEPQGKVVLVVLLHNHLDILEARFIFSYHLLYDVLYTLTYVPDAVSGNIGNIKGFSTDTRKIRRGQVFIALKGGKYNGNDFIPEFFIVHFVDFFQQVGD